MIERTVEEIAAELQHKLQHSRAVAAFSKLDPTTVSRMIPIIRAMVERNKENENVSVDNQEGRSSFAEGSD